MRLRSILAVPGHRADLHPKAFAAGADAIMLDLEDSVPHHLYANALAATCDAIRTFRRSAPPVQPLLMVRIRHAQDVVNLGEAHDNVPHIVVPKAGENEGYELQALESLARRTLALWPIIETPRGLLRVEQLARYGSTHGLIYGAEDMAAYFGRRAGVAACLHAQGVVLAAKAYGRFAISTAALNADSSELYPGEDPYIADEYEYAEAWKEGFDGAICVVPRQVPAANFCFAPTPEDVLWAQKVLAVEGDGSPTTTADGIICGAPVYKQARAILAQREG
jgi:citrate lyase beta subunit